MVSHSSYGLFSEIYSILCITDGKFSSLVIHQGWEEISDILRMIDIYTCINCNQILPGVYFQYIRLRAFYNDNTPPSCLGCDLIDYLDNEVDHFKQEKRALIKSWLFSEVDQSWNTENVLKALSDFEMNEIEAEAEQLDRLRPPFKHKHEGMGKGQRCYIDHEYEEVQNEAPSEWYGRRGEHGWKAPTIGEKDKVIGGEGDSQWNWFRQDRIHAHGWP